MFAISQYNVACLCVIWRACCSNTMSGLRCCKRLSFLRSPFLGTTNSESADKHRFSPRALTSNSRRTNRQCILSQRPIGCNDHHGHIHHIWKRVTWTSSSVRFVKHKSQATGCIAKAKQQVQCKLLRPMLHAFTHKNRIMLLDNRNLCIMAGFCQTH